jgi:hypothetical protein
LTRKLTVEELAKLVVVQGAAAEEEAAVIAVLHSLLGKQERGTGPKKSAWQKAGVSLRQLGTEWEGELRR